MKILVVDDDEIVLDWVRKHLEARDYEVVDALSGDQAVYYYVSQDPMSWHFVLSDYFFIPSKDIKNGLEVARQVRAINPNQRMAIHTSEKNLEAPVPVLHKPHQIERLLHLLRRPIKP
jgi:CheY-like chemotaxis protein